MSVLTPELKLKLAKAARELAAEIEAGKGPVLGFGQTFNDDGSPCCAMGHVFARAGITYGTWPVESVDLVAAPVTIANDAMEPGSLLPKRPLPLALQDFAFAVEGL